MAWWSRFTERDAFPELEAKAADIYGLTWAALTDGTTAVRSGVSVNVNSALKVTTVLAALRSLAEGLSTVPCDLMREDAAGNRVPATDHPVYPLLKWQPNEWMTSFEFREQMMFHAVLCGNAYAYIGRGRGKIVELIPISSDRVRVSQGMDYALTYDITDRDGKVTRLPRSSVFHLKGPSWNGFTGMSALDLTREAIGLAIATEETHARFHSNGAQPGGILTVKGGKLSKEARDQLAAAWREQHGGVSNRFKTIVLDLDIDLKTLAPTGVDSQHLELRRFQIEEICRGLKVFPQMVGHTDKTATFASAEAFFLAHVIYSLLPWARRWEDALKRDLLQGEPRLNFKFNMDGLLRGDAKTRALVFAAAIMNGYMTRNEVRELLDLNKLDGLDEILVPLNMGTQDERDAAAKEIADAVKSMLGHNGGPALDDEQTAALETKVGRVLSARNEKRIVTARDELSAVLEQLAKPEPEDE